MLNIGRIKEVIYVEAFIPNTLFLKFWMLLRAIKFVEILKDMICSTISENSIDMSEFLLGETQAQLQCPYAFGFSEAFEIETNFFRGFNSV